MKLATTAFRGMAPRLAPELLPPEGAQSAINVRVLTGDIEAWHRPISDTVLPGGAMSCYRSIFLLDDIWLAYEQEVEFARGTILGDTTFRTYITGLDAPRFTNYDLAIATPGSPPYPVETRLLGVPAPEEPPVLDVNTPAVDGGNVTLTNPGAELGTTTGWTVVAPGFNVRDADDVPGLLPYSGDYFFFGSTGDGEVYQAIDLDDLGLIFGQQLSLEWQQATGAAGSKARLGLRFYDSGLTLVGEVLADMEAPASALTWTTRSVTTTIPETAATVRLMIEFENVGGGATDAYIDAITLASAAAEYTSSGDDLATWTTSVNRTGITGYRVISQVDIGGAHGDVFKMSSDRDGPYCYREFDFENASAFVVAYDVFMNYALCEHTLNAGANNGTGEGITITATGVRRNDSLLLSDRGTGASDLASFASIVNKWVRVTVRGTRSGTSAYSLKVSVVEENTGTVLVDELALSNVAAPGNQFVLKHYSPSDDGGTRFTYTDNIFVSLTQGAADVNDLVATSYVFTYVNEFGEESAPSDPSETILQVEEASVTVITPGGIPTGISEDYAIVAKRIYRAVTGSLGSVYRLVAEIDIDDTEYTDTLSDDELGEVLESEDWDLPPSDLRYILALPNGIMVGASKNQLCFSVKNRPHAWPVGWRLATDTYITGLGNVDTSVVVGTKSFVYTASGNDPDAYSMSKPGAPHSCVSARSIAYLLRIGVVFAGPDGLMAVNGPTDVINLTETIFTREQWQELEPETITGIAHDDIYFFFYGATEGTPPRGGYALDMKPNGFGLIELGMHACALAIDHEFDALMMVLDEYNEPTGLLLPNETGAELNADGRTIYEWDAGVDLMRYSWTGKLWLLPYPQANHFARVRAADYDDLEIQFYADGVLLMAKVITNDKPFRLPARKERNSMDWIAVGTSRVRTVEIAEDVQELV
jgi:hypothetical protein